MKSFTLSLFVIILAQQVCDAQTRFIVRFRDKAATNFTLSDPSGYLSARAIERRMRYAIVIDSTDLPVPSTYVQQVQAITDVTVLNSSRWLNAITVQVANSSAIANIESLPFVQSAIAIAGRPSRPRRERITEEVTSIRRGSRNAKDQGSDYFDYGANSFAEIHLHNGEFLHNIGLRGQGMQIAMLDGGFFNYTTLKAFDSVNINGQVLSTWDFVSRNASVVEDNSHGMQCLSTIAANIPGQFVGKAPKASFHLFRTEETATEYPIEEFNWACGAERADSAGADIISSSLGYGYDFSGSFPDYPYSDLNGDITLSAISADLAAKKGILVFNSAGNSGNDTWHFITTPADADSIIAVGAVNTAGIVGSFSSYGPAPDGRIKPDLASVGVAAMVQTSSNAIGAANGTSFAGPNLAGMSTCLWQGFPEFNNMRIVRALKEAGSIYNNPNDRMGYGIPDMKKAFVALLKDFVITSISSTDCNATLTWITKDMSAMKYEIERKTSSDAGFLKVSELQGEGPVLANRAFEHPVSLQGVPEGFVQFRIKQVLDTSVARLTEIYLDTLSVTVTNGCPTSAGPSVRVAPNPARGTASVIIETPEAVQHLSINVYAMDGHLLYSHKTSKPAGLSTHALTSLPLSSGKYIIRVYDGKKAIGRTSLLRL